MRLLILILLLQSLPCAAQRIPFPPNTVAQLDPYSQFFNQRVQPQVVTIPLGFELVGLDSVLTTIEDRGGLILEELQIVRNTGNKVTFSTERGEQGSGDYFFAESTFPKNPSIDGIDEYEEDIVVELFFGGPIVSQINTQGQLTYESGQLVKKTELATGNLIDTTSIRTTYYYGVNGIDSSLSMLKTIDQTEFLADSAVYTYDQEGILLNYEHYQSLNPPSFGPLELRTRFDISTLAPGRFSYSGEDFQDGSTGNYSFWYSTALDSFYYDGILGNGLVASERLFRTDDGTNPKIYSYAIFSNDLVIDRTYYYNTAPSSTSSQPIVTGELISPNPIRANNRLRFEGLPFGAEVSIYDVEGRRKLSQSMSSELSAIEWPQLSNGIYLVVVEAKGYTPRAWKLVQAN